MSPQAPEGGLDALPSFDLSGQALVTGAAQGLGRAIALALAAAGADSALGLRTPTGASRPQSRRWAGPRCGSPWT